MFGWQKTLQEVTSLGWIDDDDDLSTLEGVLEVFESTLDLAFSETDTVDTEGSLGEMLSDLGHEIAAELVSEISDYTRYASYENIPPEVIMAAADIWADLQGELEKICYNWL